MSQFLKTDFKSLVSSALLLLAALPVRAAFAFELPADLPARDEGLWQIERTGAVDDGKPSIDVRKVWNVCLDARTDRALYELEIREEQANVAASNARCEEPQFTLSGNVLSSTMHCTGPARGKDKTGKTDIRRSITYVSDRETRTEITAVSGDKVVESDGRLVIHMKWLGICSDEQKPGDMTLMHWMVNGEETLKARQAGNIHNEIEFYKMRTASQLAR